MGGSGMAQRRLTTFAIGVSIATVGLVTVSSVPAQTTPPRQPTAADAGVEAFPPPPALSPLSTEVLAAPSAVRGTDKQQHLVYEIALLNVSADSRRVNRVEVLDKQGAVLASYAGPDEVRPLMSEVATLFTPTDVLPSSAAGTLWMDVTFPRKADVPGALLHRITTTPFSEAGPTGPRSMTVGARTKVDPREPVELSAPLRGRRLVDGNGCCSFASPHRRALLPIDGNRYLAQRFAIDWVQLNRRGLWWRGDPTKNRNYPIFGDRIYSGTSGVVISTRNDLPLNTPPNPLPNLNTRNVLGNHVIVDIGDGRFATYAHLIPGSAQVSVGDRVHRRQFLGRVGNTGSSSGPHLHFHIADTAAGSGVLGNGQPYVLRRFRLTGAVLNLDEWLNQDEAIPAEIGEPVPPARRRGQLPLQADVVTLR